MKKETLALINEAEAKISSLDKITRWNDVFDYIADLGWAIHENTNSFREYIEEETPALYLLCRRIDNEYCWEAYRKFNEMDPEYFEREDYLELIEICKEHEGEKIFDEIHEQLTSDIFVEYFEESEDDE